MKDKKAEKRSVGETTPTTKEPAKKMKTDKSSKAANQTQLAYTIEVVNTSILKNFGSLTAEDEQTRKNAAFQLIKQLYKTDDPDTRQKELDYTLKRLVRGCGASTNISRAGFYTALVALLASYNEKILPSEQIFQTLSKELHIGNKIATKEDAYAIVGNFLICNALLNSDRAEGMESKHLKQFTNILLQYAHCRCYHESLCYGVLDQAIDKFSAEQFNNGMWPILLKELGRPWSNHTLHTVHCLIVVHKKYPDTINTEFFETYLGGPELLNENSYSDLFRIIFEHGKPDIVAHPVFNEFGVYIASNSKVGTFWTQVVDNGLKKPTRLAEITALNIVTDIITHLDLEERSNIVLELLSVNLMKMFVDRLKYLRQNQDRVRYTFYHDFVDAIVDCCERMLPSQDDVKAAIIRRLVLPPTGIFNLEKYTKTRVINQIINSLGKSGMKETYDLYKGIFTAMISKNPENDFECWMNIERMNAGYMLPRMLAHKTMQKQRLWRLNELFFLFNCATFHVNEQLEICKKDAAGSFSKEFGGQCQNMFYTSFQGRIHNLQQESQMLYRQIKSINEQLQKKNLSKYMRINCFNESAQQAWRLMYAAVETANVSAPYNESSGKNQKTPLNNNLEYVFHILLMHMGLQLFCDSEMAGPAIADLLKCMQRIKNQQGKSKKLNKKQKQNNSLKIQTDPEWIEVVVDLLLHMLSRNTNALRTVVNAIFPDLCDSLNLNAIHQILAVLDMKDGNNPLSPKDEEEDDDNGDDDEGEGGVKQEQKKEKGGNKDNIVENGNSTNDENVNSDETDEDESDDDDEESEEEEIAASETLRDAITKALIENGAAPISTGDDKTSAPQDDDMDSIDLNDITEEDGRKLDEALANAFKAMKKPTGGSAAQNKKSKSYRAETTTVMHFRIRVLDLIEIYLEQQPMLLITIEIMLALYDMLEYCMDVQLNNLQTKIEKVIIKLTKEQDYTIDAELNKQQMVDFIRLIMEKKTQVLAFDFINNLRNRCVVFLIDYSKKIDDPTEPVLSLCMEYIAEFIQSRNPTMNVVLLKDIHNLCWDGVWILATKLAKQGITAQTRLFRRIQTYEILAVLYKNVDLRNWSGYDKTKKIFHKLDKMLIVHIEALSGTTVRTSPKEFQTLLNLLLDIQCAYQSLRQPTKICSPETCEMVQRIRQRMRLDSMDIYLLYCAFFKQKVIRNNEIATNENGNVESVAQNDNKEKEDDRDDDDADSKTVVVSNANLGNTNVIYGSNQTSVKTIDLSGGPAEAASMTDLRKQKKQKKEQRMEAASRGLNGGIGFVTANSIVSKEDSD